MRTEKIFGPFRKRIPENLEDYKALHKEGGKIIVLDGIITVLCVFLLAFIQSAGTIEASRVEILRLVLTALVLLQAGIYIGEAKGYRIIDKLRAKNEGS
jgi:hypothetical protein